MIQMTSVCIRFATPIISLIVAGAFFFPNAGAQSQSILELEPPKSSTPVQESTPRPAPLPSDPFGMELEFPAAEPARQIPFGDTSDTSQDEVFRSEQAPADILPTPEQSEEGMDFLMRAPLHEAFAEIQLSTPLPNPVIARQPPEAIEELPPDYKPEGDNVSWISGYWFWDEEREDFIWVSGVWRDAPEGQRWIEGYWHEESDSKNLSTGYRWVNGFWQSTQATTLNYLPQPPDPIEAGPSMPAPSEDYFYVPGNWTYQQSRYVWQPGYYSVYIEDFVWVPPCYVWTPCGYLFRPGYWDKPIHERGIVFAPVFFRQPVYLQPHYVYRPTCTINTGLAILPHLFVRRNRCHYYFGDWYADRYVNNDFCGWSNLGNHGFYYRQYDPLFNYYSSPLAQIQNVSHVHWAQRQHRHCVNNLGLRPPTVFNLSIINQRYANHQHGDHHDHQHLDVLPTSQVFLGDSLGRRAKQASLNSLDRKAEHFVRIDARQQKNELQAIDRQLQKQRRDVERQLAKNQRANPQLVIVQPTQVQILPTALEMDPARLARKQKEAIRKQEVQVQIQQKQAEAAARAQARRFENDQRKLQNQLESQVREQSRQLKRDERKGNPVVGSLPPGEGHVAQPTPHGGVPRNHPSANGSLDKRVERKIQAEQRQQALQIDQQRREQRKQLETAQRQQQAAQRQAAEALQRQQSQGQVLGNQPLNNPLANGSPDKRVQRQFQAEQRQQAEQVNQQGRDQRKQIETAQRQQHTAQRQQEAAQRQAAEAMKRQQSEAARQAQEAQRQQQAQQAAQQRQAENMRRQSDARQRQAQEAAQRQATESRRAAEKAQRNQEQQQRKQEREKKKS